MWQIRTNLVSIGTGCHATIINETDTELREAMEALDSKVYLLPYDSTAENVAVHVAEAMRDQGGDTLREHGVTSIRVQVWETETCYAEVERTVRTSSSLKADAEEVLSAIR